MKNTITSLIFITLLFGCAQQTTQNLNQGSATNDQNLQQQFDADKAICWREIKDKYNCDPPYAGKTIIRGREDIYNVRMEAERFCGKDSPHATIISYLAECLTQRNWANLWCCDQY